MNDEPGEAQLVTQFLADERVLSLEEIEAKYPDHRVFRSHTHGAILLKRGTWEFDLFMMALDNQVKVYDIYSPLWDEDKHEAHCAANCTSTDADCDCYFGLVEKVARRGQIHK